MLTTTEKGHVYWLPETPEARGASFDSGKLNHPVLVLGAERAGSVQALLVTSLGSTSLSDKFSDPNDYRRRRYLPLKVGRATAHPDNGILLVVRGTGQPPLLTKPCYLNLEPFDVEVRFLKTHSHSTCLLEFDMLEQVMRKLLELYPNFVLHGEGSVAAASSSSQSRRQQSPAAAQPAPAARRLSLPPAPRHLPPATPPAPRHPLPPAPRHLPPAAPPAPRHPPLPPAPRYQSPVATQQSALLPPQGVYSNPYGTVASRQDYGADLERNAPRQPRYPRPPMVVEGHHDSEGESDSFSGWDIIGYLGIATAIVVSVRYLFR